MEREEAEALKQMEEEEQREIVAAAVRREQAAAASSSALGGAATAGTAPKKATSAAAAAAAPVQRKISYYEVSLSLACSLKLQLCHCLFLGLGFAFPCSFQGLEYKRICKEMEELNSKKDILDAKVMALAQVLGLSDRFSKASQLNSKMKGA